MSSAAAVRACLISVLLFSSAQVLAQNPPWRDPQYDTGKYDFTVKTIDGSSGVFVPGVRAQILGAFGAGLFASAVIALGAGGKARLRAGLGVAAGAWLVLVAAQRTERMQAEWTRKSLWPRQAALLGRLLDAAPDVRASTLFVLLDASGAFESTFASTKRLSAVPLDERIARVKDMNARWGTLRVGEVLDSSDRSITLLVESDTGQSMQMEFKFDDAEHIERCTSSNMTGIGIQISNAAAVHVSDSVVRSNSGSGITVLGGTPSVFVNDSRFVENGQSGIIHQSGMMTLEGVRVQNNAGIGLVVNPDLTTTSTRVRNSQFSENQYGIRVSTATGDMASVTVEGSAAFYNSTDGISADTLAGGAASVVVSGSVASGNGNNGIGADGSGASVFVTGSTITGNAVGLSQANPASLSSLGNNMRRLNGTDSSGTIVTLTLQ